MLNIVFSNDFSCMSPTVCEYQSQKRRRINSIKLSRKLVGQNSLTMSERGLRPSASVGMSVSASVSAILADGALTCLTLISVRFQ